MRVLPDGSRECHACWRSRRRKRVSVRSQLVDSPSKSHIFASRTLTTPVKQKHLAFARCKKAPRVGLEPTTYRLTAGRSTIELTGTEQFARELAPADLKTIGNFQPVSKSGHQEPLADSPPQSPYRLPGIAT